MEAIDAIADAGFGSGDFQTIEKGVLKWLLDQADISQAVDLACSGSEDEAVPLLVRSVKELLSKAPSKQLLAETSAVAEQEGDEAEKAASGADLEDDGGAQAAAERGTLAQANEVTEAPAASRKRDAEEPLVGEPPAQRARHGLEWLEHCQEALQAERAAEASKLAAGEQTKGQQSAESQRSMPLYWKIDLPEVKQVLEKRNILPDHFIITEHPHVTLLYLGALDDLAAAKRNEMPLEQLQGMREALEALDGEEVEVRMTRIVIEERVACAVVSLPPILPCTSTVPHITLGTKMGIPGRYANELLEEVQAGRTEGITTIDLPAPRPLKGIVSLHYSNQGEE